VSSSPLPAADQIDLDPGILLLELVDESLHHLGADGAVDDDRLRAGGRGEQRRADGYDRGRRRGLQFADLHDTSLW